MGSSLYLFLFEHLLFFVLFFFHLTKTAYTVPSSSMQPLCHAHESSALFQFKKTFSIDESASVDPSAYNKVASWKLKVESGDCCSWDGVECDEVTGRVIGLDLSSSFLLGSINSSSSLFNLVHLRRLNLADNNLSYSQIPSEIGRLSRLTSLNLSKSLFFGEIPLEISKMSNLVSLDLSYNVDSSSSSSSSGLLTLEKPGGLRSLLQNLTSLKELYLSEVSIPSQVPDILVNLSSLTTLVLEDCGLKGEFPIGIFQLPKLQVLNVNSNLNLSGHLPKFHPTSPLRVLRLGSTSFLGKLPNSIENLNFLNVLDFGHCYFSGSLPASIGNMTRLTYLNLESNNFSGDIPSLTGLSQLNYLSLSSNEFNAGTLSWLDKLTKLNELSLSKMNLYGSIPSFLGNLTHLTSIDLYSNHLSGEIPSQLTNLTHLVTLDLGLNQLQSPIPSSLFEQQSIKILFLCFNNFSTIELELFLKLKNLAELGVCGNKLAVSTKITTNITNVPKLKVLALKSCNLKEFPGFFRFQDELEILIMGDNEIGGQIPAWMMNTSKKTLRSISLKNNFLTGFEQKIIRWVNLHDIHLDNNTMRGPLPIPPLSTKFYHASGNNFTGEIPPLICRLTSLSLLDLSNNNLTGKIPPCLSNFSNSLTILNLQGNNLHGPIPQPYNEGNMLAVIDLSRNNLQGKLPRSLATCTDLQVLDLSHNLINDTFPNWLGALTKLQILILRSNNFYGAIGSPKTKLELTSLRIIDLSYNGFTSHLPTQYFHNWNAMKFIDTGTMTYVDTFVEFEDKSVYLSYNFSYTMTITNKGVNRVYEKIQNVFTAIDLSSNKFEGEIPEAVGNLMGIQLLNLSNNNLSGGIPSCLGNLTNLESLDLSQNNLSGEIPQQLAILTFLEVFNVSNNQLTGPIPRGNQFDTFDNNSYMGNPSLCGGPLSRKCGKSEPPPLPPPLDSKQNKDSVFSTAIFWVVTCMGYASGLAVGIVFGQMLTTKYHEWFIETFGRKQHKPRREKRRGRGN